MRLLWRANFALAQRVDEILWQQRRAHLVTLLPATLGPSGMLETLAARPFRLLPRSLALLKRAGGKSWPPRNKLRERPIEMQLASLSRQLRPAGPRDWRAHKFNARRSKRSLSSQDLEGREEPLGFRRDFSQCIRAAAAAGAHFERRHSSSGRNLGQVAGGAPRFREC